MASNQLFQLRWGIISTGHIATAFTKDLLIDPKTRNVSDIVHKVVAVGSRSVQKAQEFIDTVAKGDPSIRAYGTYEGVYEDPNVDAIYIGTPHTYHYTNALAAIKANKHVLCEKPVTCNSAELRSLLDAAKAKGVFFMEAMWTRFQPLALEVKRLAEGGTLGDPIVLHSDLSGDFNVENISKSHRILDPALGGGALLDLAPYPLFWALFTLYDSPSNNHTRPSNISAAMLKSLITDVDSSTSFTLTFSPSSTSTLSAQAVLTCSITLNPIDPGVTIRFSSGNIKITPPIFCPKSFIVEYFDEDHKGKIVREEKKVFEYVGGGWHYEADEVARCVRDGKKESALWSHDLSLLEMDIFDEVRKQGGYKLPEGVEKVV